MVTSERTNVTGEKLFVIRFAVVARGVDEAETTAEVVVARAKAAEFTMPLCLLAVSALNTTG